MAEVMKKTKNFWLIVLLFGIIISVPEGTLIRVVGDSLSVSMMTMLRYAVAALFAIPFVIMALKKGQVTAKRIMYMAILAIPLSLDPLISQYVIATTSASFMAVLSLFAPIVLVIISTILTRDKITRNKIVGFLFAVLGGTVMIALPYLSSSSATNYGSVPVVLMLIQAICVSFEVIVWRKERERGTPLVVILGVFYFVWAIIAGVMAMIFGEMHQVQNLTINNLLIVIYLGLIASIFYNAVFTDFYRHVGTTNAATMKYFKKALTITMPIVVLGEVMSWEIALGTLLIVVGTVIVNKRRKWRK